MTREDVLRAEDAYVEKHGRLPNVVLINPEDYADPAQHCIKIYANWVGAICGVRVSASESVQQGSIEVY